MNRTAVLVLAAALAASAQTPSKPEVKQAQDERPSVVRKVLDVKPPVVRKVLDVKHLSGDRADRAVKLVTMFMHPLGSITLDSVLRTAVLVGPADVVAGAEALFAKFDAPGAARPDRQVQFRFYLVEAVPEDMQTQIPQEIAPAIEQMKKAFAYKDYRLLDTILLQTRSSGQAGTNGLLPAGGERSDVRTHYDISYRQADIADDGRTVSIRGFRLALRIPMIAPNGNVQYSDSTIATDLTIQHGQKLVVGKVSGEQNRGPIFLIVTAEPQ